MDEFAFLDATEQANLVRRQEVTPSELLEAAIRRVERLNPQLNALVTPLYDQARVAAASPLPDGPFTGVPFLLKDLGAALAGARMTMGSRYLSDYIPPHDSELVGRHRRAGLVIMGKTNAPEFGTLPTTESDLLGACRNPWDTDRSTGGSSGGSAAAVAAGMVPMAHANDGGGSIRIPAACCGVFGLKPTRGRNPMGPDVGDMMNGLIVEHAVTRSVRDSAALLDATAGPDVGAPYWAPPPARPFVAEVGTVPGRLRIAFTTASPTGSPVHPDCVAAVHDAAALCENLGHHVEESAPEVDAPTLVQAFMGVWAGGLAWSVDALAFTTGRTPSAEQFEPLNWALYQMGRNLSAPQYLLGITALQQISRQIARFMVDYDVWLTPTLSEPPAPLGTFAHDPQDPMAPMVRAATLVPFTPICNFSGQPAMSVPLYWNAGGLPIGTQFIGRFGEEGTLLRLAAQLEEARPWAGRRPPLTV